MLTLYRMKHSTNCERVEMALGHKNLEARSVWVDPKDRAEVQRVSGQPLVPVLTDGGNPIVDSMEIVRYLEDRFPERPRLDRKSTRLNSSHLGISYAVFCLKKKKNIK